MGKRHVLVVEDDLEIREALLEVLADHGYAVAGAVNGRDALEKLGQGPAPCLILLDLMMPVMDGRAFREEQLRMPSLAHIPVVVVSAYHNLAEHSKALKVAMHIKKPIVMDELLHVTRLYCS
jgi:CheY-like chemotaxis protein